MSLPLTAGSLRWLPIDSRLTQQQSIIAWIDGIGTEMLNTFTSKPIKITILNKRTPLNKKKDNVPYANCSVESN